MSEMPKIIWINPIKLWRTYTKNDDPRIGKIPYIPKSTADKLAEALRFYADRNNWAMDVYSNASGKYESFRTMKEDNGAKARTALDEYEK